MKFRDGFVSNSSSSSFLIVGKTFEGVEELVVFLEKNVEKFQKKYRSATDVNQDDPEDGIGPYEVVEAIEEILAKLKLDFTVLTDESGEYFTIGTVIADVENGSTFTVDEFRDILDDSIKSFTKTFKEDPMITSYSSSN